VREALHALAEQRVLVHQKASWLSSWPSATRTRVAQFARMLELIEDDLLASIRWPTAEELTRLHALNERLLEVAEDYEVAETAALIGSSTSPSSGCPRTASWSRSWSGCGGWPTRTSSRHDHTRLPARPHRGSTGPSSSG